MKKIIKLSFFFDDFELGQISYDPPISSPTTLAPISPPSATQKNKALLDLRSANYKKASRYFKNKNTHNAALAKMLNGQNSTCNENTAACDYLNAISYARSANESMLIKSLKSAINKDSNYKNEAKIDLEFVNFKNSESFISLIK